MNIDVTPERPEKQEMYTLAIKMLEVESKRKTAVIIALVTVILIMTGAFLYIFSNYEFISYQQTLTSETVENQQINDGIHIGGIK